MSGEPEAVQALRAGSMRETVPRLNVVGALRHLGGHRTAEEIHAAAVERAQSASIALPTI
jgi:Fur family ferric uptake transcriptional regulator